LAPSRGDHALGRVVRTAVRSCHSSGKTYTLAQLPPVVVGALARRDRGHDGAYGSPSEKLLWGEIHKAIARCPYPLFPDANLTELRIGPGNYANGFATDSAVRG